MGCNVHSYKSIPDKAHARKTEKIPREQWRLKSSQTTCRRASQLTKWAAGAKDPYAAEQGTVRLTFLFRSLEIPSQHHVCMALHPIHWVFSGYELTQQFHHLYVWNSVINTKGLGALLFYFLFYCCKQEQKKQAAKLLWNSSLFETQSNCLRLGREKVFVFWPSENSPKHLGQPAPIPHSWYCSTTPCHLLFRPCSWNLCGLGRERKIIPNLHAYRNPPDLSDMAKDGSLYLTVPSPVPKELTVMQRRGQERRGAYFILHPLP